MWAFCASVLFIIGGVLYIFAKDMMWEWTSYSNRTKGLVSERTEEWDFWATVGGVGMLILGILGVIAVFMVE